MDWLPKLAVCGSLESSLKVLGLRQSIVAAGELQFRVFSTLL
jgi:hypothetical protein